MGRIKNRFKKENRDEVEFLKEIIDVPTPGLEEIGLREREWRNEINYLINYKKKANIFFEEITENLSLKIKRKVKDERYLKEFRNSEPEKYPKFKEAARILESCYEKFKFLFSLVYPHVSAEQKKDLSDLSKEWASQLEKKLKKAKNVLDKQLVYSELFDKYILKFSIIVFHSID